MPLRCTVFKSSLSLSLSLSLSSVTSSSSSKTKRMSFSMLAFFYACLKAGSDAAGVSLSILPRHACANSYKAEAGPVPKYIHAMARRKVCLYVPFFLPY